jgi:hypothetical protein
MMVQRLAARGAGGAGGRGLLRINRGSATTSSSSTTNALLARAPLAAAAPLLLPGGRPSMLPAARACTTAGLATTRRSRPGLARRAAAPMPLAPPPPLQRRAVVASASSSTTPQHETTRDTFTITTPLFYVNAAPHMGSAYPTIAADVIARYQRLRGKRVRFVTGTDEHGEKIALAAQAQGLDPQRHCDLVAAQYRALWEAVSFGWLVVVLWGGGAFWV